jgi:hypothetical protein
MKANGRLVDVLFALGFLWTAAATAQNAPQNPGPLTDGFYSVRDFGAVGDGVADDTGAFQKAVDAAGAVGGFVMVPPVAGGKGYVLTRTIQMPEGVALIGSPAGVGTNVRAVFDLPDPHIVGPKIFARPAADQYEGPQKQPLFWLRPGCTMRGLWIMYDRQPMPTDEEFQDKNSPYYYPSFEAARANFVKDHVKPYGPTFYSDMATNITIEDITCDRYYDFLYYVQAGKCHLDRLSMFGYRKAFTLQWTPDVVHMNNMELVPNGGPTSPGGPFDGKSYTWAYGAILSQPDNVGIHFGTVDGYSFQDVTFFAIHTAVRFGYSKEYPMVNPVTGEAAPDQKPGAGPWGDFSCLRIDQCAIGLHFIWPTHLTNRIANALIFTAIDDGRDFAATTGTGELKGTAHQGAIVVESSHSMANNTTYMSTCMMTNTVVASFRNAIFGPASTDCTGANGRVFLVDGDIMLELTGFQINAPYHEGLIWAAGVNVKRSLIRLRGYIRQFEPQDDTQIKLPLASAG